MYQLQKILYGSINVKEKRSNYEVPVKRVKNKTFTETRTRSFWEVDPIVHKRKSCNFFWLTVGKFV